MSAGVLEMMKKILVLCFLLFITACAGGEYQYEVNSPCVSAYQENNAQNPCIRRTPIENYIA